MASPGRISRAKTLKIVNFTLDFRGAMDIAKT